MHRVIRILVALTALAGAFYLYVDSRRPSPAAAPPPPAGYHSDGLSDAYDGFRAEPLALPTGRGPGTVSLRIVGPRGPVTDFQRVHTEPVHLYVLRDDLSGYQHLHPEVVDGAWTAPVTIHDGGAYRVYAEFVPFGRPTGAEPTVLGVPFVIAGDTTMSSSGQPPAASSSQTMASSVIPAPPPPYSVGTATPRNPARPASAHSSSVVPPVLALSTK